MRANHLMLPVLALAIAFGSAGSVLSQSDKPDPEKLVNLGPCLDSKGNKVANAHIYRIDKVAPDALPTGHPMKGKEVARCFCDWPTFKNLGGTCVLDQSVRKANKAECLLIAQARYKVDAEACKSPAVECLQSGGVAKAAAYCAAAGASSVAGGLAIVSPEPFSKGAVLGLAATFVTSALECDSRSREIADKCSKNWGMCADRALSTFKNSNWDDKAQACRAKGP